MDTSIKRRSRIAICSKHAVCSNECFRAISMSLVNLSINACIATSLSLLMADAPR